MRRRGVLLAGLAALLHVCPAVSGAGFEGSYRLALGDPQHPIDYATVWVYVIDSGRVERVRIGEIYSGSVYLRFDPADFPELTAMAFLVAIEFPDGRWFRGPDFPCDGGKLGTPSEEFVEGFDAYFRGLGRLQPSQGGTPVLVLPNFVERRITLLHEDGSPLVGRRVPIDVYVTQHNHCGVHRGLHFAQPLTVETTDERGQVTFVSQPRVALYLEIQSQPRVSPADAPWLWRELSQGVKTGAADEIVIRRYWDWVGSRTVTLETRDREGRPSAGHGVMWLGAGAPCGFFGAWFGPTGPDGRVNMEIRGELTSEIQIFRTAVSPERPGDNEKLMDLTEEQRGRLVRDGRLTVILPPPK